MNAGVIRVLVLACLLPPLGAAPTATADERLWSVGESWTLLLDDPAVAKPVRATLIVAEMHEGGYGFGLNATDPRFLHAKLLPLGTVSSELLAYHVQGEWFQAVSPPLRMGTTWRTRLGDQPVEARVTEQSREGAWIEYRTLEGRAQTFRALYDPGLVFFRELVHPNGVVVRVTGHGFDPTTETAWQPLGARVLYGRAPGDPNAVADYRGNVIGTFEVPPEVDTVSMRLALQDHQPGFYQVRFRAPYQIHSIESTPLGTGIQGYYDLEPFPEGTWSVEEYVVGDGGTWAEAVGWQADRTIEVWHLPESPRASLALPEHGAGRAAAWFAFLLPAVALGGLGFWRRGVLFWPLLARLKPEEVLRHGTRERLLRRIREEPGITTQELRRYLHLPWATSVHHLTMLEHHGVVAAVRSVRRCNWFALDQVPFLRERKAAAALRTPGAKALYEHLQKNPGASPTQAARALGVRHTTVLYHLRSLVAADVVQAQPYGRRKRFFVRTDGPV